MEFYILPKEEPGIPNPRMMMLANLRQYGFLKNVSSPAKRLAVRVGLFRVDKSPTPTNSMQFDEQGEFWTKWRNSRLLRAGQHLSRLVVREEISQPFQSSEYSKETLGEIQEVARAVAQHFNDRVSALSGQSDAPREERAPEVSQPDTSQFILWPE